MIAAMGKPKQVAKRPAKRPARKPAKRPAKKPAKRPAKKPAKKRPAKKSSAHKPAVKAVKAAPAKRVAPSVALPHPGDLERICKGLAVLDTMLCEDWELRYFSFNAAWNEANGERMASLRNGEGDDWFFLFSPAGTFFKAFWHEHQPEDVRAIYDGMPAGLTSQLSEPAFSMERVTLGGFHDGTRWTIRGNAKPMQQELALLTDDPAQYRAYAKDYFEVDVSTAAIGHVLLGKPLAAVVGSLSTDRTLEDVANELIEIGYDV
jgi:hypothetical protein